MNGADVNICSVAAMLRLPDAGRALIACLQRYLETGIPHILNKGSRAVVALHKDRHMVRKSGRL
jgi:hypothetical protein